MPPEPTCVSQSAARTAGQAPATTSTRAKRRRLRRATPPVGHRPWGAGAWGAGARRDPAGRPDRADGTERGRGIKW